MVWLAEFERSDAADDEGNERASPAGVAPGKRTLVESLPPRSRPAADARTAPGAAPRWAAPAGSLPLPSRLRPSAGAGAELPRDVRTRLEASFGLDLTPVRVHTDGAADRLGARALNHGRHIHFGGGEYAPHSDDGYALLAHEVAHIAQLALGQAPPAVRAKIDHLIVASAIESDADVMAERARRDQPAWSGAAVGRPRPLPDLDGPVFAKLKVDNDVLAANAVAELIVEHGLAGHVVAVLERWVADSEAHDFKTIEDMVAAARAAAGGDSKADPPAEHRISMPGGDAGLRQRRGAAVDAPTSGPEESKDRTNGARRRRRTWIICIIAGLILLLGVLAVMSQYDIRTSFDGTAAVHRRPLEPVIRNADRLRSLADDPRVQHVRGHIEHKSDHVPESPELEQLLEQFEPELAALAPMVESAMPALQTVVNGSLNVNDLDNPANVGLYHEQIMLPATGQALARDVGRFPDGARADAPALRGAYGPAVAHYDGPLMEQALQTVLSQPQSYATVTDNCHDFVSAVTTEYQRLGGHEVVLAADVAVVAITDLLIAGAGWHLDRQIDGAVNEHLASLPPSTEASQCARDLAERLGIDGGAFAGAIDTVLARQVELPELGSTSLRTALCTSPAAREVALSAVDAKLDSKVAIPHQGDTTARQALCQPKRGTDVLRGVLFDLVHQAFGATLRDRIPAFIRANAPAAQRLLSDLTRRLTDNLYARLNLRGLCP